MKRHRRNSRSLSSINSGSFFENLNTREIPEDDSYFHLKTPEYLQYDDFYIFSNATTEDMQKSDDLSFISTSKDCSSSHTRLESMEKLLMNSSNTHSNATDDALSASHELHSDGENMLEHFTKLNNGNDSNDENSKDNSFQEKSNVTSQSQKKRKIATPREPAKFCNCIGKVASTYQNRRNIKQYSISDCYQRLAALLYKQESKNTYFTKTEILNKGFSNFIYDLFIIF